MLAYITGTSTGIGKALAEKLLTEGHYVIGLSRHNQIEHPNFTFVKIDLSHAESVLNFNFQANPNEDIILVNNAGTIGPIKPIGFQIDEEIMTLNQLNISSPQILSNKFIHRFKTHSKNYQIINISSGAGKHPIDAWSTYCASKAAIDLFSETIAIELSARGYSNWRIHAIAPGVVDTPMQLTIRESNPSDFLNHQKFVALKKDKELTSPDEVAEKLFNIIKSSAKTNPTVFSIKKQ